jgi:PLP dependent protein
MQRTLAQPDFDTLSMGMSGDMDAAVQAGSTMVRVGSAIFGTRPAKTA